jgi:tRNA/tmRNA/rRNA uracil-C5-methylase (TrmA/RlmC/RlmD family)
LRYAQFFVEKGTGLVQLALVVNLARMSQQLHTFCEDLQREQWWHSLWINFNPHAMNRIFGDTWFHHSGKPWLWQEFGLAKVAYHPGSFSQVHLPLFEKLLQTIERWVPQGAVCLELFAGTGAISLFIRKKCKQIDLIENNPLSALSFTQSLRGLPDKHLSYHLGDAIGPLGHYDVIIADPSRKGLGKPLLQDLKQNQSHRLIYVSCDFGSFQRDAEELIASGWKLKEGEGFFFFPGTNEIETAALFERVSF